MYIRRNMLKIRRKNNWCIIKYRKVKVITDLPYKFPTQTYIVFLCFHSPGPPPMTQLNPATHQSPNAAAQCNARILVQTFLSQITHKMASKCKDLFYIRIQLYPDPTQPAHNHILMNINSKSYSMLYFHIYNVRIHMNVTSPIFMFVWKGSIFMLVEPKENESFTNPWIQCMNIFSRWLGLGIWCKIERNI